MRDYRRINELEQEAKEKLGDKAAQIIAEDLKIDKWNERTLTGCSPFSIDNNPSFSWNPKENCFKDFSSGINYGIIDHYMSYSHMSRMEALKTLLDLVGMKPDTELISNGKQYKEVKRAVDEEKNDRALVEQYMAKRGISKATLDFCNVKQSKNGLCAFQFLDEEGRLVSTKYRISHSPKKGELKWYWQKDITVHDLLYGVDKIDTSKPLLIVEGCADRLAVVEAGYKNVVSIPNGAEGDKWIDYNYDFLSSLDEIILWFDNDEAGENGRKKVASRLGEYRVKLINPEKEVEDKVEEYYIPYGHTIRKTDANNVLVSCGGKEILRLISEAKAIENPRVRKLMEFQELEVDDIPHISTGIEEMDRIFGGIYENSLTIITGKAGDGKSNIINTMYIISPLENMETVFLYSGELPTRIVLGNMMPSFASRRHLIRYQNENRPDGFKTTRQASDAIHRFYMDRLYIYDEDKNLGTDSISLYDNMIYAYKRHGCTNFIIDNLLSLDCLKEEGESYFDKEASFVRKLKVFANKYPVKVCLIIHTRKTQAGAKYIEGDDIQGSSTHIKVCDRAYSVTRLDPPDKDGNSVEIRCIKDRQKGLKGRFLKVKFDIASKRLYSTPQERDKKLSWESGFADIYPEWVMSRLVCNIKEYDDDYCEIF